MGNSYIPILFIFIFAFVLAGGLVALSSVLGRPRKGSTDISPYECGLDQASVPRRPVSIRFFTVAIVFLLFDVELALLYPWAAVFRSFVSDGSGAFVLAEGLVFIAILAAGLVYICREGALDWER